MATSDDMNKKLPVEDSNATETSPPPYSVQVVQPGVSKLEFTGVRQQPQMDRIYFAIFAILCCFWPLGLVALLKAIRGMQAHYNGDLSSAEALNKSSKKWSIASIVVGVLIIVGVCFFAMLANVLSRILITALSKNDMTEGHGR